MDVNVVENLENVSPNNPGIPDAKRLERNKRRRDKRRGIYNLTSWHVSRLRNIEETKDEDYAPFIQYIKWMGKIPPNEDDYNEDYEYFFEMLGVFRYLGGYEFFEKHNLTLPPCGIGGAGF